METDGASSGTQKCCRQHTQKLSTAHATGKQGPWIDNIYVCNGTLDGKERA